MRCSKFVLLLCSTALAAPVPATAADDEGAKLFGQTCTTCHNSTNNPLDKKHLTKDQWSDAIKRMKNYGVDVPSAKTPQLLDYLARTHGPADAGKK